MSELIRREDALKAIEARAYDLESTDSINTAYGCRLGGDVVRALPAIGTCKDCANGHPHGPDIRCAYLWEILMHVEDASSIFRADPSLVGPDDFCSLYKEAKADA